jgi:serine/threonine protein kinase
MFSSQQSSQQIKPEPSPTPETLPCELVNGAPVDWSGRGTSHVDYEKDERVPLIEGRLLGYGASGGVYETEIGSDGIRLAWKRIYIRHKIRQSERREIEIIKRLSHPHIIRLIGTYTRERILGLLIWPVATCDLATLLDDADWLRKHTANGDWEASETLISVYSKCHDHDREPAFLPLGLTGSDGRQTMHGTIRYLEKTIGCIASAVSYLHSSGIKHKDLKPSNVVLSANGLWVTDFGSATDFSTLSSSLTNNGERGTPKYFSPEVASYEPSGSASDIFAMGCIFLEIITLCMGYSLETTQSLRTKEDKSYQANLDRIISWFDTEENMCRRPADEHLVGLIRHMMRPNPGDRPRAAHVEEQIALIGGLSRATGGSEYSQQCCGLSMFLPERDSLGRIPRATETFQIIHGNIHRETPQTGRHHVKYFIEVQNPHLVEKVHLYTVSTAPLVFISSLTGGLASKFQSNILRSKRAAF